MAARSCIIVGSSFLAVVCVCSAFLAIWGPSANDQAVLLPESWPRSLPGAEGGGTSWIAGRHVLTAERHTQPRMIRCNVDGASPQACTESPCGLKLQRVRAAMMSPVRWAAPIKDISSSAMIIHGLISVRSSHSSPSACIFIPPSHEWAFAGI